MIKKCKICGLPISKDIEELEKGGIMEEYKDELCYDCYLLFKEYVENRGGEIPVSELKNEFIKRKWIKNHRVDKYWFENDREMITIPIFRCPACGGEVYVNFEKYFDEWECIRCYRIWGIETSKPVFKLGLKEG